MKPRSLHTAGLVFALFLVAAGVLPLAGSSITSYPLLSDFPDDWLEQWKVRTFSDDPNRMQVVEEDEGPVLEFESTRTASGLWRKLKIEPLESGRLSWRWKVDRTLDSELDERHKLGDDYAARVFVIFRTHFLLPNRTRAICYVWSDREPVGAVYPNPYIKGVRTVVLQSGEERTGEWVLEERDVVADYVDIFGERPRKVSGFAVMVDTDNTGTSTRTRFDDLVFHAR